MPCFGPRLEPNLQPETGSDQSLRKMPKPGAKGRGYIELTTKVGYLEFNVYNWAAGSWPARVRTSASTTEASGLDCYNAEIAGIAEKFLESLCRTVHAEFASSRK
jgi:hypothetical protein